MTRSSTWTRRLGWAAAGVAAVLAAERPAHAQTAEQEAVLSVIERLFDGMRAADSAAVRSTFHPDAVLIGTEDRDGNPSIRIGPIDGFVQAVGQAAGEWDERFWDWEVRTDENLASVWTTYSFHLDGRLSHCGVDGFLLARDGDEWKIVSLADTRRRAGCGEPPEGAR